jgi:hypothetical protein
MASYAEVAAQGPEQTPEEAAAPQPAEIVVEDSVSTSSLVDVDAPSVRTVPSDFLEQDVQTDTQASRIEREEEADAAADEKAAEEAARRARHAKSYAGGALAKLHACLTNSFESMSDGTVSAIVFGNLAGVVGVSAWLSYKAWGLHEQGRLSWKAVGLGAGAMGAISAVEVVLGG